MLCGDTNPCFSFIVKKENGNPPPTPEEHLPPQAHPPQAAQPVSKAPPHGPHPVPGYPAPAKQQPPPSTAAPGPIDTHFMQQHSQIFVFTTQLANQAADAVLQRKHTNILAYHMDQPSTKKFLQVVIYLYVFLFGEKP